MNTYAKKYAQCHLFRIASAPVRIANAQFPHCQLPCFCQTVSHSCIANTPFLYCQHASSILTIHPVLSHGYQQPYCKRTIPVLSTCQFRIVTTPFRIANTPFPAKQTLTHFPQAKSPIPANTKRGAAQHSLHGSSQKKKAVTYSPALHCSTIGASGLNFSVRNGKRWDTTAIAT